MKIISTLLKDRYYQIALAFLVLAAILSILLMVYFGEKFEGTLLPELIGFCLEGAVFLGVANAIIKHREAIKRKEHLAVAFYPVRNALLAYCNVLFHVKKATSRSPEPNCQLNVLAFLDSINSKAFLHLPLLNQAPVMPSSAPSVTWHEYLRASTLDFRDAIDKALDRYITLLEAQQTKALEDIANDQCIKSLDMSVHIEHTQRGEGFPGIGLSIVALQFNRVDKNNSQFEILLSRLRTVAEICVKYCDVPLVVPQNWGDNIAPKTGEAFS